jgi:hypothetical protein
MKKKVHFSVIVLLACMFCASCSAATPTPEPTPAPPDATTAAMLYYTGVYHTCYKVATETTSATKIDDPIAYCDDYLKTALEEDWFNDMTLPAPPAMVPNVPPEG